LECNAGSENPIQVAADGAVTVPIGTDEAGVEVGLTITPVPGKEMALIHPEILP
jgi:Asp-tRNA(Asn)/Glu-tRNA(Gln) amidotransferase A subunit family amidase